MCKQIVDMCRQIVDMCRQIIDMCRQIVDMCKQIVDMCNQLQYFEYEPFQYLNYESFLVFQVIRPIVYYYCLFDGGIVSQTNFFYTE